MKNIKIHEKMFIRPIGFEPTEQCMVMGRYDGAEHGRYNVEVLGNKVERKVIHCDYLLTAEEMMEYYHKKLEELCKRIDSQDKHNRDLAARIKDLEKRAKANPPTTMPPAKYKSGDVVMVVNPELLNMSGYMVENRFYSSDNGWSYTIVDKDGVRYPQVKEDTMFTIEDMADKLDRIFGKH